MNQLFPNDCVYECNIIVMWEKFEDTKDVLIRSRK
jgi:hypothetical protein